MGLAERATRGEVAPSQASKHGDTGAGAEERRTSSNAQKASAPDTSVIAELPGTSGIPVISDMEGDLASFAKRPQKDTMPRGLAALAALGTILSVGGFLVFRDRVA